MLCSSDLEKGNYAEVSTDSFSDVSSGSKSTDDDGSELLVPFMDAAAQNELDFYTCFSLTIGLEGCTPENRFTLFTRLPTLVALQVVVPLSLLSYTVRHFQWAAKSDTLEFRSVGFIVYLYSVWNMYNGSTDECRTIYLHFAKKADLNIRYTWIAILGETVNGFCGFALVITLFTVFCLSEDPFNLVINCMAINFLCNVDNEFADDDLKRRVTKNARRVFGVDEAEELESRALQVNHIHHHVHRIVHKHHRYVWDFVLANMWFLRTFGTLGFGHVLAFVFLFARRSLEKHISHLLGDGSDQ